jgi:hypothetical protein
MSTAAICAACGQNVWVGSENRCTSCGTANSLAGFYDVEQTYVPAVATLGTIAGSQRTRPGLMLAGALTAITGAMISATGVGIAGLLAAFARAKATAVASRHCPWGSRAQGET